MILPMEGCFEYVYCIYPDHWLYMKMDDMQAMSHWVISSLVICLNGYFDKCLHDQWTQPQLWSFHNF